MNFTKEQQQAIDVEGKNVIVSAGAGSGKTAVLTERVLRKIQSGTPIQRLLILTFTKAAAQEMKERIRKKLRQKELWEALNELDCSYITTFDSFALSVVKKYHVELGLPKEVGITEDAILRLERRRILDELFDELYAKEEKEFLTLLSSFALKDDHTLKEYILHLHDIFENILEKEELFEKYEKKYYSKDHLLCIEESYLHKVKEKQQQFQETAKELLAVTENKFQEKLQEIVTPLFEYDCYDTFHKKLDIKLPVLPRGCSDEVKQLKSQLSSLLKELRMLCRFESQESILEELESTKENTLLLLKILKELDQRYSAFKRQENLFHFMDIARFAIQAVRDFESIREEIRNSFDEIMVDEYQDTNDIQEAFLSYIEHDNIYMVGDMKQSIYRFRNANPMIFKEKYDRYKKQEGGFAIDLSYNFRSRKEVLEDINLLFSNLMDEKFGGVTYHDGHAMIFGNQLYLKEKAEKNYDLEVYTYEQEKNDSFQEYEKEIFIIGEDILKKIKEGYQVLDKEKGKLRPIQYKDFAILLDRSKYFHIYKKIFEYLGIPLIIQKEEKLSGEMDISLIKNMYLCIQCIAHECFDATFRHAFTSLSRSFLFQVRDDEIYQQLISNTFYESEVYQLFLAFKDFYDTTTPSLLLSMLLEKTHYEERLVFQGNVKAFRKRMEYLYSLATSLEKSGKDNNDFLALLTEIANEGIEMSVSYQEQEENAVHLMSIHKSKGLEFPICYFADLKHAFNLQELKDKIQFHPDYGILLPSLDDDEENKTILQQFVKEDQEEQEISERIRLFYVALTRAKEKMIIVMPKVEEDPYLMKKMMLSFQKMLLFLYPKWQSKEVPIMKISSLSKDYLLPKTLHSFEVEKEMVPLLFTEEEKIEKQNFSHLSKQMMTPLTEEKEANVALGLKMHSIFERIDFEHPDYETLDIDDSLKKSIQVFLDSDFLRQNKQAKIYREYEFLDEIDHIVYHGIIDLLLVKENEAIIVDYKLKNVEDKAYCDQLLGYKKVIEKRTGLPTKTYLYSILEQKLQEIFDK